MPRFILLILAVPLLIVLLAALLLPALLDEKHLVELASRTLQEQTGARLDVAGEARLTLLPGIGVTLSTVTLSLPDDTAPTLAARRLELGIQLLPLLSRRIEIGGLRLDGLDARVPLSGPQADQPAPPDTNAMSDAQLDAYYAARREAMNQLGDAVPQLKLLAAPLALNIDSLELMDSRITLLAPEGKPTLIELRRFQASDVNTDGRPMTLSVAITLPADDGSTARELAVDGTLEADLATRRIRLDPMTLSASGATAEPVAISLQGDIDLERLGAELAIELSSGATRGTGSARFASRESPQIQAKLALNRLDPALLLLAGPDAASQAETVESAESGDEPLPLELLRALSTEVELTVDQALYGNYLIENLELTARGVDGLLDISSLTGRLFDGALSLSASINARRDAATLTTSGQLTGVNIAKLLTAAETEAKVSGSASFNWQLTSRGATPNELLAGLSGPARLTTESVVLQEIGIQKLLCESVAMVNQQSLSAELPLESALQDLSADIELADGYAVLSPLRADMREVQLRGTGRLGLLSREFSARFAARLSPELAELDPACRVNERYAKLDWPVNCRGRIASDPADWCAVDTGKIIRDLATGEAERKLGKEAGKLLDRLFRN